jgi:hypothetical protein
MINEVRSYLKSVIYEVDSDLKEHDEYFVSDNIADTNKEDTYFIKMGELLTERQDSDMVGELTVDVQIWKNGYTNIRSNLDAAYCKAIDIQAKCMDQSRFEQNDFIKGVVGLTILPSPVEDNGNLASFNLQFIITVGYKAY